MWLGGCDKLAKRSIWRLQSLLMASGFEATESHHARMSKPGLFFIFLPWLGNHKHLRPPGGLPLSFFQSHHFGLSYLASTLMDHVGALGVVAGVVENSENP
jgi:hypothetical protein